MRTTSNNNYQKPLPFNEVKVHSSNLSEEDAGYDSFPNPSEAKARINSAAGLSSLSSSSSSNNQVDRIINLVKNLPSPTDVSTTHSPSDLAVSVAQRIAQFSERSSSSSSPVNSTRKITRTRIQPLPDSTSDSAGSFARSNHLVLVSSISKPLVHTATVSSIDLPPFSNNLEYIHDDRFDSTTTVDHIKNDIIAIEFVENHPENSTSHILWETTTKQQTLLFPSLIERFGESLQLLPANVLAVIVLGLITGLVVSALVVFTIA